MAISEIYRPPLWGISLGTSPLAPTAPHESSQQPTESIETESIIIKLLWDLRQQGVLLTHPEEIYDYLLRFPDLIGVIYEVVLMACTYLQDAQLSLEVYRDPEIDDEHLVLYARWRVYDERTMDQIRSVRDRYRPLLAGKSGWLILTTDFQQPV